MQSVEPHNLVYEDFQAPMAQSSAKWSSYVRDAHLHVHLRLHLPAQQLTDPSSNLHPEVLKLPLEIAGVLHSIDGLMVDPADPSTALRAPSSLHRHPAFADGEGVSVLAPIPVSVHLNVSAARRAKTESQLARCR